MTFKATHSVSCDTGINHPNQYFSESQKVLQAKVSVIVYYIQKYPSDQLILLT
jgi:hypothetical protein